MKKILLTLALAFCCVAGQGQTTAIPAGVNIQELNTKWAKFTQYAEQKQINKAVEEGIRVSTLFTQNRQYKEAFATCRQMDALIYYSEQEKKSPEYKLRFMVGKERLRMYTNLKNTEQCKILLKQLHSYTDLLKSDSLQEELLMTEANYYQTFGMTDKSLECYNILFQKRSTGKDEKGIDQCYKDMLGYAEQNNNAPLAIAMRKLYTSWQDSIKAVKTANSASHKILAKLTYVEYYSEFKDFSAAEKMLKECRELFDQDKRLDSLKKRFYRTEAFYYQRSKQFVKALEAVEKQKTEEQRLNEYAMSSGQYRLKGEIYRQMGRPDEAVKFLKKYIEVDDSLKIANEQLASSEYATLLNVEKLNAEKKELMLRTKEKELSNKTTLIFSLIILLAILFLFLYRESRLNRRLKASESELRNKNEELTYSREELRKARDQAEATSQMKTTFIQSMSHEIRTPLNSIIGFSQVLSDHYGNEETKEFVNIIKANTDDLLRLVTDVLALSELDQYNKLPTNIQTDINMICQLSIEVAKMQKQDTVEFLFKPEREKLIILSNPERISQLLANLAHNAIKFTTHGSIELTYSVLEAEKKLEISVTDTGIGIPKEKQEKVFERFYKMNSFSQGTGLGLSISRTIAEKLGGSLHIDSSYTDGCRMVLTLPLVYAE